MRPKPVLCVCVQLFTGADPAVSGPAGGRGEAPGPEVLLDRPGIVPQRAPSLWTQKRLGASLTGGKSLYVLIRCISNNILEFGRVF